MILVTGATGKVGSEVVRVLRQQKVWVRALVTDRHKTLGLAQAGAELAVGDSNVSASLDEAMAGITPERSGGLRIKPRTQKIQTISERFWSAEVAI